MRDDDWECAACKNINYASRVVCNRCGGSERSGLDPYRAACAVGSANISSTPSTHQEVGGAYPVPSAPAEPLPLPKSLQMEPAAPAPEEQPSPPLIRNDKAARIEPISS